MNILERTRWKAPAQNVATAFAMHSFGTGHRAGNQRRRGPHNETF